MKIEIVTLFPDYFDLSLRQSVVGKAREKQLFEIEIINLRDFATDKHRSTDEPPYGGGGGMVLKLEPLDRCLKQLGYARKDSTESSSGRIILTSAAGPTFNHRRAEEFSLDERLTIICGHYLGVDERLLTLYDIEEISIGDYVLSGGEPAAAVIVDAVARLIPKVLGNFESALDDSFMNHLLGAPCFTRPPEYEGLVVPGLLLSGDHAEVRRYRMIESLKRTRKRRPDLFSSAQLADEELKLVAEIEKEEQEID